MRIRRAEQEDAEQIEALAVEFYNTIPMAEHIPTDEETVADVVDYHIEESFVVVADDDGCICGFLIGMVVPSLLNYTKLAATELAWYLQPHVRGGFVGVRMLRAFERWAKANDATIIAMSCFPDTPVPRLYEKLGYSTHEIAFMKRL